MEFGKGRFPVDPDPSFPPLKPIYGGGTYSDTPGGPMWQPENNNPPPKTVWDRPPVWEDQEKKGY